MRKARHSSSAFSAASRKLVLCLLSVTVGVWSWHRMEAGQIPASDPLAESRYDVLRDADNVTVTSPFGDHPLIPALRFTYARYERLQHDIGDYTCKVFRQERIAGRLRPHEMVSAKVRHRVVEADRVVRPFSVYLKHLGPTRLKGRETLYVEGRYFDRVILTKGGGGALANITLLLNPTGSRALSQNRYSIKKFGMKSIARELIERGMREVQADEHPDEWEIRYFKQATIDKRPCTCLQARRTTQRENFSFYLIRLFFDDELDVPVRFTTYTWPRATGDRPILVEAYTYTDIRLNPGLTDAEFDVANPSYGFDEQRVMTRKDTTDKEE